ncbi:hypothetical protein TIFTF001_008844 [Ficus carica]|uniref:Uncharacterized protein n=1 Tax=Ficus carica TaxID=3494 RepID=A0AA88DH86_FICCA|nr:hypothetical protein TIFTF001_008844 [Ficus carica]
MAPHIIQEEIKAGKRSWSYHHDDAFHALMANKAPLAMTYVHPDNLSGENIKGLIDDGKPFQISFPSDRIPEWFFHRSRESHFEIETSLEDPDHDPGRKRRRKGFALFVVFEIKEHDQFVQAGKLNSISCHFTIDKKPLANSLVISDFKDFMAGSNAVCCYVPLEWFAGRLNTSSLLVRSYVSKKGIVIKLRRFIIHQVFENGIEDFSNRLAQRAPDHLDREKLSDGESQVEHNQSGGENSSKASRNKTEHSPNACDNIRQEGIEADHEIQEDNENWLMKLRSILSLFCLDVINFLTRKRLKG